MDKRLPKNPWPEMSGISFLKDLELLEKSMVCRDPSPDVAFF
jgi:hypothetical protein